jgi:hypothetical protein
MPSARAIGWMGVEAILGRQISNKKRYFLYRIERKFFVSCDHPGAVEAEIASVEIAPERPFGDLA